MDSTRSHLRFIKTNIERPRYKPRGGGGERPFRENIEYGQALLEKVLVIQESYVESIDITPPEFNPEFIFRLKVDGNISEDEFRRSGITLLSEEPEQVVVLFSEDQLAKFKGRINSYKQEMPDDKNPPYHWISSVTEEMSLWNRDDRLGKKLSLIEIDPNIEYKVDVELWSFGDQEENDERFEQLKKFINHSNGEILDSYVRSSINISRIRLDGKSLERLLGVGIVQSVDLPPQPHFSILKLINRTLDEFPNPVPSPPENAPGICVIDSGVNRGHPMLGPAIGDSKAFPNSFGDGLDRHGHGTMVSGIALYGDVEDCIKNLDFTPEVYLFVAQVTNDENKFDDDRLIINQMSDAITYFNREYGCRVFNISLGDPSLIYDGGKPSSWAYILDYLARELNLVIVVPTGNNNEPIQTINDEDAVNRIRDEYPSYLLDENSRIIEPSTAANVITVGSVANSETIYRAEQYPNDPAIRPIAKIYQPSPFTRRGPGVNDAIKPEVCDYGGNLIWDGHLNQIRKDPGTGIVSTNNKHFESGRLFGVDVGSSFAAPRVAHLAGLIIKNYPDFSSNQIRALIANSTVIPNSIKEILNEEDIINVCGYGIVDHDRALYSADNRVTLIAQDSIPIDRIHLYEIPIPDEMKETKGLRRISISLAYDPPVKHTRKDYLGIKMEFRLFRGLQTQSIINWFAERPDKFTPDKIPDRNKCSYKPSMTKISKGTMQKAIFEVHQNRSFTEYEGDNFQLMICCKKGWASEEEFPRQNYGLACTIEHVSEQCVLYQNIQQRIRTQERIRPRA